MSTSRQRRVTAVFSNGDVVLNLEVWDNLTGGEIDSEEQKYKPGGMGDIISLGGSVEVGNVTIERLFKLGRDTAVLGELLAGVGTADMVITDQWLDTNKNPYGKPLVYRGTLKTVTPPEHDSNSSDPAKISLEITSATVTVLS